MNKENDRTQIVVPRSSTILGTHVLSEVSSEGDRLWATLKKINAGVNIRHYMHRGNWDVHALQSAIDSTLTDMVRQSRAREEGAPVLVTNSRVRAFKLKSQENANLQFTDELSALKLEKQRTEIRRLDELYKQASPARERGEEEFYPNDIVEIISGPRKGELGVIVKRANRDDTWNVRMENRNRRNLNRKEIQLRVDVGSKNLQKECLAAARLITDINVKGDFMEAVTPTSQASVAHHRALQKLRCLVETQQDALEFLFAFRMQLAKQGYRKVQNQILSALGPLANMRSGPVAEISGWSIFTAMNSVPTDEAGSRFRHLLQFQLRVFEALTSPKTGLFDAAWTLFSNGKIVKLIVETARVDIVQRGISNDVLVTLLRLFRRLTPRVAEELNSNPCLALLWEHVLKTDLSDLDKETLYSLEELFWAYAASPLITERKRRRHWSAPLETTNSLVKAALKVLLWRPSSADERPPLEEVNSSRGIGELCGALSPLKPRNLATVALLSLRCPSILRECSSTLVEDMGSAWRYIRNYKGKTLPSNVREMLTATTTCPDVEYFGVVTEMALNLYAYPTSALKELLEDQVLSRLGGRAFESKVTVCNGCRRLGIIKKMIPAGVGEDSLEPSSSLDPSSTLSTLRYCSDTCLTRHAKVNKNICPIPMGRTGASKKLRLKQD